MTDVVIWDSKDIEELDFSALLTAGTFSVSRTLIEQLEFPSLLSVSLFFWFKTMLRTLVLPRLQIIYGNFGISLFTSFPKLSVQIPSLRSLDKVNLESSFEGDAIAARSQVQVEVCVGGLLSDSAPKEALRDVIVDLCPALTQHVNASSSPTSSQPAGEDWACPNLISSNGNDGDSSSIGKLKWWELGCIPSYGRLDCSYPSPVFDKAAQKGLRITGNFSAAHCVDWTTGLDEAFLPITSIILKNHNIFALSHGAFDASLPGAKVLSTLSSVDVTKNPLQWVSTDIIGANASQAAKAAQSSLLIGDRSLFKCPEGGKKHAFTSFIS